MGQEKMPWPQLLANDSEVSKLYLVDAIPFTLLLDRQGKIIEVNPDRGNLLSRLDTVFGIK